MAYYDTITHANCPSVPDQSAFDMPASDPPNSLTQPDYKRLFERSAVAIFRSTIEGQYLLANPAAVRMHGYSHEAELLESVQNIADEIYVDNKDRDTLCRLLKARGSVEGFECEIYRHNTRERIWVRQNIYLLTDAAGAPSFLEGQVEDITAYRHIEEALRLTNESVERTVRIKTAQLQASNQELRNEIAERKLTELSLRENETLLRSIIESSSSPISLKDMENKFVLVNKSFEALFDTTSDQVLGKTPETLVSEEHAKQIEAAEKYVLDTGKTRTEKREQTLPNGDIFQAIVTKFPVVNQNNDPTLVGTIITDIREQKRTESILRTSEARISGILDTALDAIISIDENLRIELFNQGASAIFGYLESEVLGRSLDVLLPNRFRDNHGNFVRDFARSLETSRQMSDRSEITGLRKDGTEFSCEASISKMQIDGKLSLTVILRDISDRKEADQALEASEALLKRTFDSMSDALLMVDPGTREIVNCNEAVQDIFGYSREEVLGKNTKFLYPSNDDYEDAGRQFFEATDNHQDFYLEHKMRRADGTSFIVEHMTKELRDNDGDRLLAINVIRDITERKATEEQLRQSQKMEAIGQLTGGFAHDFNNLLGVIVGNLDFLKETYKDDSESLSLIDPALQAALSGAELNRQLLAYSRQQPLMPKVINLKNHVSETLGMLRRALGETVEIALEPADPLWLVDVDKAQLDSALLNLAVNARDAMPQGGIISIQLRNVFLDENFVAGQSDLEPGDYVMLELSDTGTGISAVALKHVFEPFFSTKEVGKGTGLGLSMVFGFVKQSGGHISIDSEVGKGTAVQIYLPRAKREPEEDQEEPENLALANGEVILVVEDDTDLKNLISKMLIEMGYEVLTASDGQSALETIQKTSELSLLLTDVILPGGMSGPEIAEEVYKRFPAITTLFMSGYPRDTIEQESSLNENVLVLEKPFRKSEFSRRLREALAKCN